MSQHIPTPVKPARIEMVFPNHATIVRYLIQFPLFDGVTAPELALAVNLMSIFNISAGKTLFREGDSGDYMCFIVEGKLDVLRKNQTKNEVYIATLHQGHCLGEFALIDESPRSATVVAQTDCVLVSLSRLDFELLLHKYPNTGITILKGIARLLSLDLRQTSQQLANYLEPA